MIPDYQLIHGDCLIEMDAIADNSIDMILADLPFGTTACAWDIVIPFEPLWVQYKRVLKNRGAVVLFGSQPFTTILIASSPYFGTGKQWFRYEWIWDKGQSTNFQQANTRPLREHESILIFGKDTPLYSPQMSKRDKPYDTTNWKMGKRRGRLGHFGSKNDDASKRVYTERYPSTILEYNAQNDECNNLNHRLHPTQKPVALLSYLIKTYSNEGDAILDNTCGSGSTLEAAMRTGRNSIGIELYPLPNQPVGDQNPDYFVIASRRLANVARELRGEWKPLADNGKGLEDLPMFAGGLT